jgi:hypothetical protein
VLHAVLDLALIDCLYIPGTVDPYVIARLSQVLQNASRVPLAIVAGVLLDWALHDALADDGALCRHWRIWLGDTTYPTRCIPQSCSSRVESLLFPQTSPGFKDSSSKQLTSVLGQRSIGSPSIERTTLTNCFTRAFNVLCSLASHEKPGYDTGPVGSQRKVLALIMSLAMVLQLRKILDLDSEVRSQNTTFTRHHLEHTCLTSEGACRAPNLYLCVGGRPGANRARARGFRGAVITREGRKDIGTRPRRSRRLNAYLRP